MYRELKKLGFYINYVVCKSELKVCLIYLRLRFILTMWYVNVENGKRFKLSDFVLY